MGTIVTDTLEDPKIKAQRAAERATYEKACAVLFEIWLAGYRDGEGSFESLMCRAHRAVRKLRPVDQHALLGRLAADALSTEPARKRGKPRAPRALRDCAIGLVELVTEREKLPTRPNAAGGVKTKFERVSEIFAELGVRESAETVERWYYERHPSK